MKTSDFSFYLPEELIAQTPLERRDASRLLCLDKVSGATEHRVFSELPELLGMCDRIYVMNEGRLLAEVKASEATQESIMGYIIRDTGDKKESVHQ